MATRFGRAIMCFAVLSLVCAARAEAQCSDPTKHFRSGIWKQWIYWTEPGPQASAAVQRIIAQVNESRAAAALPLLIFDPVEPLVVGIFEETNPRGPNGASLANRLPNQEIFLATFAEVESGGEVVLFLTDPLRSNAELTAKGIPGGPAVFQRNMKSDLAGSNNDVSTKWVASNAVDEIKFNAEYSRTPTTPTSRFPGTSSYLNCNVVPSVDTVYRSRPTETFSFLERNQSWFFALPNDDVQVSLRVRHHDADIDAMFNDPANQPMALLELDRVVRFERK
jgi:hypothetical protein